MTPSDVKATLSFSDGSPSMELPIYKGTIGPEVIDIRKLVASHYRVVQAANVAAPTGAAVGAIEKALGAANVTKLLSLKADFNTLVVPYSCQLNYLSEHQTALLAANDALAKSPKQWQKWFYIDAIGMVLFIPFIFLTKGRWSPAKAKEDLDEREEAMARELKALQEKELTDQKS